ncbi:MAG: acyltransferase [Alteromonadaceae bacterium]|nr:acyltransferase [Alteromonadaceae bacterium]
MFAKLWSAIVRRVLGNEAFARRLGVKIGSGCRILTGSFGSEPFLITIGDNVTISHGTQFINHDGAAWLARDELGRRFAYRRIVIGDNCFVGANTILMPGVRLGNNVIVAAGSVVTKSVPDGVVVGGNPAHFIAGYQSYIDKALNWCDDSRFKSGVSYRDRVCSGVEVGFKPSLAVPDAFCQSNTETL